MITGVLNRLRARLIGWAVVRGLLGLAGLVGGLALVLVLLDAATDLPEPIRLAVPGLLGLVLLGGLALGLRRLRRISELRVARALEQAAPALGNVLTNAVQFADQSFPSPVSETLRQTAVDRGRAAATGLEIRPLTQRRVIAAAGLALVMTLAWLGLGWLGRDLVQAVVPRFLDPRGDHPPYSQLQFSVQPVAATVLYGGQTEVRATVAGGSVEKLWVVAESPAATTRTMMFLSPDRSFFQTLANVRADAAYYVTDGHARSRRFPIRVRYTPQITGVELTTEFPAYTDKPAHTAKLPDEPLRLPLDTKLRFRVTSNRPLAGGSLTLTPLLGGKPVTIALTRGQHETEATGGFTVTEAAVFALAVRDVSGLESTEPRQGRVQVLPDNRPQIVILEPGRNAVATPDVIVPVRVQAQDDYGVTRVRWFRSLNRSPERPADLPLTFTRGPTSVDATNAFRLAELGVKPGDAIEFFCEAVDNYPRGPNVTTSRLLSIQIISREQYDQILRRRAAQQALFDQYQVLTNWLRRVAERANGLARQGTASATELNDLATELGRYRHELAKLFVRTLVFDLEKSLRDTLRDENEALGRVGEQLASLARDGFNAERFRGLADQLRQLAGQSQDQVAEPLRHLGSVAELLAQADRFVGLAQRQGELVRLLRRFADRRENLTRLEQMELQELASAQRHIQSDLRDWLATVPELLGQVPPDAAYDPLRAQVTKFLGAVRELRIPEEVAQTGTELGELRPAEAFPDAQRAAEHMESLVARCEGLPAEGEVCLKFQPTLRRAMGDSLRQILAALGSHGQGEQGQDGYSLFSDDVALFGPTPPPEKAGDAGPTAGQPPSAAVPLTADATDPQLDLPRAPTRIRLQPDAKFPLRYRALVGEYFRAIAESGAAEGE